MRFIPVFLLLSALAVTGQPRLQEGPHARKKIALTLGGGGALGIAHVGVLEWLEEHRIPIDSVTGTSMGALIGGVYASGMSAKEVHQLVQEVDWNRVFRGGPDFRNLQFRRKEDRRAFPNPIELGLRNGVRTPSGFNSGQGLMLLLNQIFLGYPADKSFDDLPTPFRCVAADLVTGDRVEFDRGSLAEALRASSAIPGVFVPVRRDGQVLVDGGIVDNLPVEAALAMGADVVIASVLPVPKLSVDDIQGIAAVAGRAVSISIVQNERRSMRRATHVLEPAVADFSSTDYEQHEALIRKGYEAASRQAAQFLPYALDEAQWQKHLERRRSARRATSPRLDFVEVSGGAAASRERVEKDLAKAIVPGPQPVRERVESALAREFGTMRYTWIDYSTIERDGQSGLVVRLIDKRHAPPFLFFAPEIRGEDGGRANLTLNARAVFTEFAGKNAELRTDVSVGSRTLLGAEYYRRLGRQGFFLAPRASYSRTQTNIYALGLRAGEADLSRSTLGLDAGFTAARFFELRAGFDYGRAAASTRIGDPIAPGESGVVRSASIRFAYDGQDSPQVPHRGLRAQGNLAYFLSAPMTTRGFPFAQLDASYFHPLRAGGADRLFILLGGGSGFGQRLPLPLQLTLGGPLRLGAFGVGQFRGDRLGYATTGYLRRIGKLPPILGGDLFLGAWAEGGLFQSGPIDTGAGVFKQSGTIAFVAETPLGPVYAGWSLGRTDSLWRGKFSFLVGRFF